MNSLDDILNEWEKDSDINKNESGNELIKIPKLHSKYLRVLTKNRLLLYKVDEELLLERRVRYNYYSGNFNTDKAKLAELGLEPFQFILKQDVGIYIDTDPVILKIKERKALYEEKIRACELIMKELNARTYQLRGNIDWIKFTEGG